MEKKTEYTIKIFFINFMSKNISVGTRKIANYGWPDRSQKKFWWKIDLGADVQIAHPSCL